MISATLLTLLCIANLATATTNYNSTLTDPGDDSPWFDGSIPATSLSESCGRAYAQDIPCDESLLKGLDANASLDEMYSNGTLKAVCTDTCLQGLQKWRDDIRKSCTDKDAGSKDTPGLLALSSLLSPGAPLVGSLYWSYCIKDLNKGTFCRAGDPDLVHSLPSGNASETTPETIDAFCKDNCQTQFSLILWVLTKSAYSTSEIVNVADARKVCKGLDKSKYPFLKDVDSTEGSSGSSGSGAGSGTGAKNDGGRVGRGVGLLLASVVLATVGLGSF